MKAKLLSIGAAAKAVGVSIDTLRRWDKSGRLQSIRSGLRGHRFYLASDIEQLLQDQYRIAREWAESSSGFQLAADVYCPTRDVFQVRLETLQAQLGRIFPLETVSLLTAVTGEIGNNSFDHNLGNWPDILGIFFSFDVKRKTVILADRGQGILATLKRIRPQLSTAGEALRVAFTETISGRNTEARGNGLKFVRSVITSNSFVLYFQTGDAYLSLNQDDKDIFVQQAASWVRGCFATIKIKEKV